MPRTCVSGLWRCIGCGASDNGGYFSGRVPDEMLQWLYMQTVKVPQPKSNALASQLVSLYNTFKQVPKNESLVFDLSAVPWLCPALLLPISVYINSTSGTFTGADGGATGAYLNAVHFPAGVDSVSVFEAEVQRDKTYIPISTLKRQRGEERERLETMFSQMVYRTIMASPGAQSAIYYPITELVTNIFEHSKKDEGYIFGQWYPKKNYLDICIVDRGCGLAQSYKDEQGLDLTDEQAISAVMKGESTKQNKERGYGVRTSKQVVCRALRGEFMLVSGSKALLTNSDGENLVDLPDFKWQGVIIAYRIPKPTEPVDIFPYLE